MPTGVQSIGEERVDWRGPLGFVFGIFHNFDLYIAFFELASSSKSTKLIFLFAFSIYIFLFCY
jgi:hypothetical protein